MNIKIPEFAHILLQDMIFDTIQFGNLEGNDKDFLHIVSPNRYMDSLPVDTNHCLFYKDEENNEDNLYITPRGFVNGLVTGGNTLFFELLRDGRLEGTVLDFLHQGGCEQFITYKMLKAFIGCSERDFKQASSHKAPIKKLKWAREYLGVVVDFLESTEEFDTSYCQFDLEGIKSTRLMLNISKEHKHIPNTISKDQFNIINKRLLAIPEDNEYPMLHRLGELYFNTWSK